GNQLLALVQCQMRGLQPGPINTFPGWQALGRNVKRGEHALVLCMPITRKRRNEEANDVEEAGEQHTYTSFVYKSRWFVVSQTVGDDFTAPALNQWAAAPALEAVGIQQSLFTARDGNSSDPIPRNRWQLPGIRPQATDCYQPGGPASTQDAVSRIGPCHLRSHR